MDKENLIEEFSRPERNEIAGEDPAASTSSGLSRSARPEQGRFGRAA
jgi:hypothetical protein